MTAWTTLNLESGFEAGTTILFASGSGRIFAPKDLTARIGDAVRVSGFTGADGRWLDIAADSETGGRLLLIGFGDDDDAWRSAGGHMVAAMSTLNLTCARLPAAADLGEEVDVADLLEGALLHGFALQRALSGARRPGMQMRIALDPADAGLAERAAVRARSINRARAWVEQPANLLTPSRFAQEAEEMLARQGVTVRALDRAELEHIGAHGLLAVASGSDHEPRMVIAEWRGTPERAGWDAALIGKGVTFDGGGLNLKARPIIEKMKFDMAGAAAVLSALELAASRKSRCNLVAVVPMTENVISGKAYRPGDVIDSLAGLTIEVINTDAEGRIILADAITYAIEHYDPACIVDVATLTGLITGILHEEFAALYASDDALAEALLAAGHSSHETLWRMPLSSRQDYLVESSVADLINYGPGGFLGFGPGSATAAAKFLERFSTGRRWAHVDMAGVAWATRRTSRGGPGATGFGVGLLDHWLCGVEAALP